MAKWVEIRKGADFQSIGEKFGISSLTARLIRNKDITEESEIRQYLYGGLSDLCSASVMKGIIPAVEILQKKIKRKDYNFAWKYAKLEGVERSCRY